jgi:hypothetical protein
MVGRSHQLKLGLNRAGAGHGDEFAAANLKIEYGHHSLLEQLALQDIRRFGKSFVPIFAHFLRSVLGKDQATGAAPLAPPSKGGDTVLFAVHEFRLYRPDEHPAATIELGLAESQARATGGGR